MKNMKTKTLVLLLTVLMTAGISAARAQGNQRIAYIDTEYILQNIPEYGDAQEEINQMSAKWAKELKTLSDKLEQMKRDYQTESVLLSDAMKKKKEEAIAAKEQELTALQMQYYGPEGEMFTKRAELIQPIQEKIYNAITQVSQQKNYAFVFDKASGTTILYCNEKFDISDDVLDEIGNVMQTVRRQDRKRSNSAGSCKTDNKGGKTDNKGGKTDNKSGAKSGGKTDMKPEGKK